MPNLIVIKLCLCKFRRKLHLVKVKIYSELTEAAMSIDHHIDENCWNNISLFTVLKNGLKCNLAILLFSFSVGNKVLRKVSKL